MMVVINGLFIYGCIIQLVFKKSFGNNPMDDIALVVVAVSFALFTVSFLFVRLDTVIDKDGVYEQMFPFQLRFQFTPWEYIADASVIKTNPIGKFGGWGIKYGFRKKSYTMSGCYVLQLKLNNDKKIFIGTQRPEELADFLNKLNADRKQE